MACRLSRFAQAGLSLRRALLGRRPRLRRGWPLADLTNPSRARWTVAILQVGNALILRPRGFDAAGAVIIAQRCRRVVAQDDGSVERLVAGDQGHGCGQAGPEPVRAEGDPIMGLRPGPDDVFQARARQRTTLTGDPKRVVTLSLQQLKPFHRDVWSRMAPMRGLSGSSRMVC